MLREAPILMRLRQRMLLRPDAGGNLCRQQLGMAVGAASGGRCLGADQHENHVAILEGHRFPVLQTDAEGLLKGYPRKPSPSAVHDYPRPERTSCEGGPEPCRALCARRRLRSARREGGPFLRRETSHSGSRELQKLT